MKQNFSDKKSRLVFWGEKQKEMCGYSVQHNEVYRVMGIHRVTRMKVGMKSGDEKWRWKVVTKKTKIVWVFEFLSKSFRMIFWDVFGHF